MSSAKETNTNDPGLPPNLTVPSSHAGTQSPMERELFHYALVLTLLQDGRAVAMGRRIIDGRRWLVVRTVSGQLFSIVRPDATSEQLDRMLELARQALKEKGEGGITEADLCGTAGRAKMKGHVAYWVYENWVAENKAVVHVGNCGYCRDGQGCHQNTHGEKNGRWRGPFPSRAAALADAHSTKRHVSVHRCVSKAR